MAKALVVLADGFEEVEAITVIDVLRRGGVETVAASLSGEAKVSGAHGITLKADASFPEVSSGEFDAIVLPGGGAGTDNLRASESLKERLRRQKEDGRLLCAICAAPLVLMDAGVLSPDQHVTCYPTCVVQLDRKSANVPVVSDGDVITGQGPGASLLFALVVLKALAGENVAQKIARNMVTDVLE
jgi:4-methyl-5(b-hydroxyethyl)-thiazole monophosphate biosynthesis